MKKLVALVSVFSLAAVSSVVLAATEIERITAEEAFDLAQMNSLTIALVDVRSKAEYYWVGAACQVDAIETDDRGKSDIFYPDYGKVVLDSNSRHVEFYVNDRYKRLNVKKITKMNMSPMSFNIPYKTWTADPPAFSLNAAFPDEVKALHDDYGYLSVIFFCRSGGRSEDCVNKYQELYDVFEHIYEIDQPDGTNGRGGFEGTSYSDVYNGYRGYPGRLTEIQDHPSVSWKDAGLPIKTGLTTDLFDQQ